MNQLIKTGLAATALALMAINQINAQDAFLATGNVLTYYDTDTGANLRSGYAEVLVEYNANATPYFVYGTTQALYNDDLTFTVTIYDDNGTEVGSHIYENTRNNYATYSFIQRRDQRGTWLATQDTQGYARLDLVDRSATWWDDFDSFPSLPEQLDGGRFILRIGSNVNLYVTITDLSEVITDSDGDGIPDDQDACIFSDLRPTVIIGDNDSGVTNTLFSDGCTIADLIAAVLKDSKNHGQFVSGVAKLTNQLKADEAISGKDKGKIQGAAAKSK